ncbi:hypothetical protein ACFVZ8_01225 [Streptomyces sp. NPDC059558]|uniref:hypothetical protein n=1 Tax=unclassified Streptomyces TaxID=2593676 RepID=UPI0009C2486F|nr:hypothetical protein [Streptomyces sp. Sge12]ARE76455.1 hypothetical protein B6R96_22985 [Streptomyces sp. Sge12]
MNRRPLVIAAATVGVLATAAVALPNLPPNPVTDTIDNKVYKEAGKRFASAADAPKREKAPFALPSWIPKDATDVRIRIHTTGEARMIRFTLGATPLDGPQCGATTPKPVGAPELHAKWWPGGTLRDGGRSECRGAHQYQVVVRGKQVYAWTDGTPGTGPRDGAPALRAHG